MRNEILAFKEQKRFLFVFFTPRIEVYVYIFTANRYYQEKKNPLKKPIASSSLRESLLIGVWLIIFICYIFGVLM